MENIQNIEIFSLCQDRWSDFETLFGPGGACYGCWCVWWRMTNKEFNSMKGDGHKEAMRTIVHQGVEPGLLAYMDGQPAGWVTVAPRAEYPRLKTSRLYAALDDQPVWSIPCFYVGKVFRRQGLTRHLIDAAVEFAKAHGAKIVEAYPSDLYGPSNPMSIYRGVASTFREAGFTEAACRKPGKPVMRKKI